LYKVKERKIEKKNRSGIIIDLHRKEKKKIPVWLKVLFLLLLREEKQKVSKRSGKISLN